MKVHSMRARICVALFISLFTSITFAQASSFVPNRAVLGGTDFIDWQSYDDGSGDYTFLPIPAAIISVGGSIAGTITQPVTVDGLIFQEPTTSIYFRPTNFPDGEFYYSTNIIDPAYNPVVFNFGAQGICGLGTQVAARLEGQFTAMIEAFDASDLSMGFFMVDGDSADLSAAFLGIESTEPMSSIEVGLVGDSFANAFFAINQVDFKSCAPLAPVVSCDGFDAPMAYYPVEAKKNSVFPLKMELFDETGFEQTDIELTAAPVVDVMFIALEPGAEPVDVSGDALSSGHGTDGNQFEFTGGGYWQYNLQSKNYSASGEYVITAVSGDESEYVIDPSCITSFVIK